MTKDRTFDISSREIISRVPSSIQNAELFDCHMHTFDYECVPDNFFPKWLMSFAKNHLSVFIKIMKKLSRRWEDSKLKRMATFASAFNKTQLEILDSLYKEVNQKLGLKNMHYLILMMDMNFMDRGNCPKSLRTQLQELIQIRTMPKYQNLIYPFLAVDPRREIKESEPNLKLLPLFDDFKNDIFGLKLYCGLGYFPVGKCEGIDKLKRDLQQHPRKFNRFERKVAEEIIAESEIMDMVYKIANDRKLPIITHCGIYNAVYTNMPRRKMITKIKIGIKYLWDKHTFEEVGLVPSKRRFFQNFTRTHYWKKKRYLANFFFLPQNYRSVLKNYPNLKLCFGHFGGQDEWDRHFGHLPAKGRKHFFKPKQDWMLTIIELMREFDNAYADLAYNMCFTQLYADLNDLLSNTDIGDRILYATDYFFNEGEQSAFQYNQNIINRMKESMFLQIAQKNPKKFLFG